MNRNDFIELLEGKVQVNRQMIGEVCEMIDIFPYFQSAHLILLKGLRDNGDIKFEKQLRLSAIHIADREILYNHLAGIPETGAEKSAAPTAVTPDAAVTSEKDGVTATGDVMEPEGNEADQQQTVIESAKNSDQLISEIEMESADWKKDFGTETHEHHSHPILITSEAEVSDDEEVMIVVDEEQESDDIRIFYMDPGFSVPGEPDLLELEGEALPEAGTETSEADSGMAETETGKSRKQVQSELIDKFILANPRIEPVRDPAKLPQEDIARPHTENKEGLVTETLARIYVSQGYYSRAIEIYEKLSLKYPEKSSYFASQIELVKEHLKK